MSDYQDCNGTAADCAVQYMHLVSYESSSESDQLTELETLGNAASIGLTAVATSSLSIEIRLLFSDGQLSESVYHSSEFSIQNLISIQFN
jgi:hypothetical protein